MSTMVKHIVMWNVHGATADERARNAQKLKDAFEGLRNAIPGLLKLEIGVDQSRVDYACDVVLYSEFDSAASLAAYANKVPYYQTGAQIKAEWLARHPGGRYPDYDPGGMVTNLFLKPPGWRAAEGFGQPALGYPR